MRKKVSLINQTSGMKTSLKERLRPSGINFGKCEYHRLNRVDEK
jgi:hypothetical protein